MAKVTTVNIDHFNVRYRKADTKDAWSYVRNIDPDQVNVNVLGQDVERNIEYEVQAQQVSSCGLASDWSSSTFTIPDGTDAPPDVNTVTSQPLPLAVQFTLGLSGNGKLPAGCMIEVHTAPDVSGSAGTFTDTGFRPTSRIFTIGSATNVPIWYMFRTVDQRGNVGAFSTALSVVSTQITDVVGGIGGNLMDPYYSIVGSSKLQHYDIEGHLTLGRAASTSYAGYKCLQITSTSSSVAQELAFVKDHTDNTTRGWMNLSPKKYSVQAFLDNVSSDANGPNFAFEFFNLAGSACSPVTVSRVTGHTGVGVYSAELDLTGATDTIVHLRQEWNAAIGNGHAVNMQAWAVFEMAGTSGVTPDFVPAPAATQDNLQDGDVSASILAVAKNTNGAIDFSLADTGSGNGAGIENADTIHLNDGAGLGLTADATQTTNLPATVAAAVALGMLGDAQTALPLGTVARQVIRNDGGAFYADNQYSLGECDSAVFSGTQFMPADQNATGSMVNLGNYISIPNPGGNVTVKATAFIYFVENSSATSNAGAVQLLISFDGGSTFTSSPTVGQASPPSAGVNVGATAICAFSLNGTPTGNIVVKAQIQQPVGSNTITAKSGFSSIDYAVFASSNGSMISTLSATVPATASMSCTSTSPVTTCTASKNVTVTQKGTPTFTDSWAKSAGTGTLSGTTLPTVTVTDSETTTSAGATHTTTMACTVKDSQVYTGCTATHSGSNTTVTTPTNHGIPNGALLDTTLFSVGGDNVAGLTVTGVTANTFTFVGGAAGSATGGTVNNVRVTTSNCVLTGTFTRKFAAVSVSISGGSGRAIGDAGNTVTANGTARGAATGGDGTFTWSNSKPSGSYTLSGSTSQTPSTSEAGIVPGSDSGTLKMIATDGETPPNTGNTTATLLFRWSSF